MGYASVERGSMITEPKNKMEQWIDRLKVGRVGVKRALRE